MTIFDIINPQDNANYDNNMTLLYNHIMSKIEKTDTSQGLEDAAGTLTHTLWESKMG